MKKKEMYKKIQEIFERVDTLEGSLREAHEEIRGIRNDIEYLPSEDDELEDDDDEG